MIVLFHLFTSLFCHSLATGHLKTFGSIKDSLPFIFYLNTFSSLGCSFLSGIFQFFITIERSFFFIRTVFALVLSFIYLANKSRIIKTVNVDFNFTVFYFILDSYQFVIHFFSNTSSHIWQESLLLNLITLKFS